MMELVADNDDDTDTRDNELVPLRQRQLRTTFLVVKETIDFIVANVILWDGIVSNVVTRKR